MSDPNAPGPDDADGAGSDGAGPAAGGDPADAGEPLDTDGGTGAGAGAGVEAGSGPASEARDRDDPSTDDETGRLPTADKAVYYLQWAAVAFLVLFALVAAVSLYTNVSRVIQVWITEEYQPVVSAAFNLVVFLLATLGISVLLRRLAATRS